MVNGVTSNNQPVTAGEYSYSKSSTKDTTTKSDVSYSEAVIYEKNSTATAVNRADTIKKLKADADAQTEQLRRLVEQMFLKQGSAATNTYSTWQKLADEGLLSNSEASQKASDDISENGYWGVEQTSDRILSFASALAGGDEDKMREMVEAFKKGYKQAEKAWGQALPDLCKNTYDAVIDKFNKWFE